MTASRTTDEAVPPIDADLLAAVGRRIAQLGTAWMYDGGYLSDDLSSILHTVQAERAALEGKVNIGFAEQHIVMAVAQARVSVAANSTSNWSAYLGTITPAEIAELFVAPVTVAEIAALYESDNTGRGLTLPSVTYVWQAMLALEALPASAALVAELHELADEIRASGNVPSMSGVKCEDAPYPGCPLHRMMGWAGSCFAGGLLHLGLGLSDHVTIYSLGVLVAESVWRGETHPQLALWERIVGQLPG